MPVKLMIKILAAHCLLLSFFSTSAFAAPKNICVFDPIGKSGDVFVTAQDLSSEFLSTGVSFELKLYLDENKAKRDFKTGICDGVILTGLSAREFNRFAAAIEAPGMMEDYSNLGQILAIAASEKAAKYMRQGNVEIAGIYPAGSVYMVINDRSRATPRGLNGMRIININDDDMINSFAQRVGARSVVGTTNNFAKFFKEGKVDITFAPMALLEAFELDKAAAYNGGIPDTPIALLTLQLVINADRFPEGFGQQAREISLNNYERVLQITKDAEAKVPGNLWIDTTADRDTWARIAMTIRKEMVGKGYFHPKMIAILNRFRCNGDGVLEGCENL